MFASPFYKRYLDRLPLQGNERALFEFRELMTKAGLKEIKSQETRSRITGPMFGVVSQKVPALLSKGEAPPRR